MPLKQRKVAVMGSRSVGKSSLVIQFVQVIIDHGHNAIIYDHQHGNHRRHCRHNHRDGPVLCL